MNNVNQPAFQPGANTVNLAVTTSTGNVQVQSSTSGPTMRHVRFYNSGTVIVFIAFGATNAVTAATTTGMPIAPGAVEVLSCPHSFVAAITASGTATLYMTPGEGL